MTTDIFTPDSCQIIHESEVDFIKRIITKTIHVMQYDKCLPIIAVKIFMNGTPYTLPTNAQVKMRWGKKDHTFVYKSVLGCNITRQIVYFDVDEQMTYYAGLHTPILELFIDDKVAGTSYIPIEVDRNPIQHGDIGSHLEYIASSNFLAIDANELKADVAKVDDTLTANQIEANDIKVGETKESVSNNISKIKELSKVIMNILQDIKADICFSDTSITINHDSTEIASFSFERTKFLTDATFNKGIKVLGEATFNFDVNIKGSIYANNTGASAYFYDGDFDGILTVKGNVIANGVGTEAKFYSVETESLNVKNGDAIVGGDINASRIYIGDDTSNPVLSLNDLAATDAELDEIIEGVWV